MSDAANSLCEKIDKINESADIKAQLKNLVEQVDTLKAIIAKYDEPDVEVIPVVKMVSPEAKVISTELK